MNITEVEKLTQKHLKWCISDCEKAHGPDEMVAMVGNSTVKKVCVLAKQFLIEKKLKEEMVALIESINIQGNDPIPLSIRDKINDVRCNPLFRNLITK